MTPGLRGRVLLGASWFVGMRWALRVLGLVSTAIVARVLTPEDFGTVAAVMAVAAVVNALLDMGVDVSLIKNPNAEDAHYDTAWTMRIVKSVLIASTIVLCAPLIGGGEDTDQTLMMTALIGLSFLMRGAANIGTIKFQKELQISRIFIARVVPKCLTVVSSIALALALRNYWALILAITLNGFYMLVISYLVSPYRPRLTLSRFREIWSFSQWVFVRNVSRNLMALSDRAILSARISKAQLGYFSTGGDVASIVTTELMGSASQALVPAISKLQDDRTRLVPAVLLSLNGMFTLTIPAAVGVCLTAREVTLIILGPQWGEAVPLVALLAFTTGAFSLTEAMSGIASMFGLNRNTALLSLVLTTIYLGGFVLVFEAHSLQGVLLWKIALSGVEIPILLLFIARSLKLSATQVAQTFWRPAVASGAIVLAVSMAPATASLLGSLVVKALLGALAYGGALLLLWTVSGRRGGLESIAVHWLSGHLARLARALSRRFSGS